MPDIWVESEEGQMNDFDMEQLSRLPMPEGRVKIWLEVESL